MDTDSEQTTPNDTTKNESEPKVVPQSQIAYDPLQHTQRRTMMAVIIAALVILLGGSFFVFAMLANSPEARLSKALTNLRDANSVRTSVNADIQEGDTSLSLNGEVATLYDPLQMSAKLEMDVFITRIAAEAMYLDGNYYIKVSGLAGLESLLGASLLSGDLGQSQAEFEELATAASDVISQLDGEWIEVQGSIATEAGIDLESIVQQLQSNFASIDNLEEVFAVQEVFVDEDINGESTVHMEIALEPGQATEALVALTSGVTLGNDTVTQEEARRELEDAFDKYDPATDTVDVWIEKRTNQLVQLQLIMPSDSGDQLVTINMDDYDAVEPLVAPENPKSMLEVMALFSELQASFEAANLEEGVLPELSL